jgi:hypothetical protein
LKLLSDTTGDIAERTTNKKSGIASGLNFTARAISPRTIAANACVIPQSGHNFSVNSLKGQSNNWGIDAGEKIVLRKITTTQIPERMNLARSITNYYRVLA